MPYALSIGELLRHLHLLRLFGLPVEVIEFREMFPHMLYCLVYAQALFLANGFDQLIPRLKQFVISVHKSSWGSGF